MLYTDLLFDCFVHSAVVLFLTQNTTSIDCMVHKTRITKKKTKTKKAEFQIRTKADTDSIERRIVKSHLIKIILYEKKQ